jgi:adenylate cyclase
MDTEQFKRKLTAILSADVKGYSRLMGEDEATTVLTLKTYRGLIAELVQKHRGRVVDSPGDNLLAEFSSVVDAVRCAVEIQEELKTRNDELSENRRMEFRIGVNMGDVIEDEERIYGDGVNIAARIEGLAKGAGICVSASAYEQIGNKLDLGYEYLGEHDVKNIAEPVRVYRVLTEPQAAGKVIGEKKVRLRGWQWPALAAVLLIIGVVAAAFWYFHFPSSEHYEKTATIMKPAIPLVERASIAVLPFQNLSGDKEQEYFSDGITNDIITDLSKFRGLFVIASKTVFTYKSKPVKVQQISEELGVRYVWEGSVQKLHKKVRINAQLIDANTGHHLWAERYDRDIKDLFAVQDEMVQTIVATLAIKVRLTRAANLKAREMFEKAIELDSSYASAYTGIGWTYYNAATAMWTEFPIQAMEKAMAYGQKALSIGEPDANTYALIGSVHLRLRKYDLAISELQQAIQLNPNHARSHIRLGTIMLFSGRTDEAIQLLQTGLQFHPNTNSNDFGRLGLAYYLEEKYEDAIRILEQGLGRNPDNAWTHIGLAAAYAQAGRSEEARRSAEMVKKLHPFFEVDSSFTLLRNPSDRNKILEGLRKAGLE